MYKNLFMYLRRLLMFDNKPFENNLYPNFIRGEYLSLPECENIYTSFCEGGKQCSYLEKVKEVKSKLKGERIKDTGKMVNVFYDIGEDIETPILVRLINLVHKGSKPIVLNKREVLYDPNY